MVTAESQEFKISERPDRVLLVIPGLKPNRARAIAEDAVREARRRMPKSTGYSASRIQPLYGKDYAGVRWLDCLAPGNRVLKSDWTWVPVESLEAGDELIGFDEEIQPTESGYMGRGRRYRTSEVVAVGRDPRKCVEIEFDDGFKITTTESHPWLTLRRSRSTARQWLASAELKVGDSLGVYFEVWDEPTSYEEGWLGGLLDGEGSYAWATGQPCSGLPVFAQNKGPVLDRALAILDRLGFEYTTRATKPSGGGRGDCVRVEIRRGFSEHARLFGSTRPVRLLPRLRHEGRPMKAIRERKVVAVRSVGEQDVVLLETSTGTYMAEGMGSHNSYVFFQDRGISPFTMRALAGKVIPMWVDDPTGTERSRNPKAKTRVTINGRTQVLIFRKAAKMGARKTKYKTDPVTGIRRETGTTPQSYPGAPGRIAQRETTAPMTTPGRVAGQIARGNGGVRWRHPGLAPRLFLNTSITMAAQRNGVLVSRLYIADGTWRARLRSMLGREVA